MRPRGQNEFANPRNEFAGFPTAAALIEATLEGVGLVFF